LSRIDRRQPVPVLDNGYAALQYCGMMKVLPVSKRGTITLPPSFRRRMGIDRVENPLMLVREEEGKLIMELATAVPVREFPESAIRGWIAEDEADGEAVRKMRRSRK
jgi:bifunctional DNA-binding transcriptional regulator/antitoxin component of YhaV-PrlF toxin-antitoxin module